MILTVDIGNTNIVLGVFREEELVFTARISTDKDRTADEYSVLLRGIFEINGFDLSRFEGIILSSVVPQLNSVVEYALSRFTPVRIKKVGPGIKTGFKIIADDPAELGSDMVCNAAGALSEFSGPMVIVDFGTATTFTAVNADGNIYGVIIAPGMRISAEALWGGTAQLPHIPLNGEVKALGSNTADCMRIGIVGGAAAMVDGLVQRIEEEAGGPVELVVTGGVSELLVPHIRHPLHHRPDLRVTGLYHLSRRNSR